MGARLSQDERRAVAQRIFAALCARYPDRYIALLERPRAHPGLAELAPVQDARDSADGEAKIGSASVP
jgi:hypothetical protein